MRLRNATLNEIQGNPELMSQLQGMTCHDTEPESAMWAWLHGEIEDGLAVLIEDAGVVLAWMILYDIFGTTYYGVDIFVAKDHRGKGFARRLIHESLTHVSFSVKRFVVYDDRPVYRHVLPHGKINTKLWEHHTYLVPRIEAPVYSVYQQHKGANTIFPEASSINEVFSMANHTNQDALYRVFLRSQSGSERFVTAFSVLAGQVSERPMVTIPKAHW